MDSVEIVLGIKLRVRVAVRHRDNSMFSQGMQAEFFKNGERTPLAHRLLYAWPETHQMKTIIQFPTDSPLRAWSGVTSEN